MSRYARQTILPEVGAKRQARLADARVLIVGAGGLAAPALPLLAGAGVGHLTIVDGDDVDLSNLHRKTLFTEKDCGQLKAQLVANRCRAISADIVVEAMPAVLTPANAPGPITGADLVLDCEDSYAASYTLSDICLAQGTPLISASVLGLSGYVGGFCGTAPSLCAVFPAAPDSGANCTTTGVLSPVVGILGAMQAQMALAILLALDPSPLGQVVRFDARSLRSTDFRFDDASEPATGFRFAAPSQLADTDLIVELRDEAEAPEPVHPQARRIAPEDMAAHLPGPGKCLALCCATGLRAWRVAERIQPDWPREIVLAAASTS